MSTATSPCITSFLIKIASRCNLDCDYCYVYHHADQGWRLQPPLMSAKHRKKLADRIGEYAQSERLENLLVVFHGGEPLLAVQGGLSKQLRGYEMLFHLLPA